MLNGLQVAPDREHKDNCALSETIRFSGRHILLGNAIFEDARASHAPPDFRVIIIREETAPRLHPPLPLLLPRRGCTRDLATLEETSLVRLYKIFFPRVSLIAERLRGSFESAETSSQRQTEAKGENGFQRDCQLSAWHEGAFLISKGTFAVKRHKLRCFRANRSRFDSSKIVCS